MMMMMRGPDACVLVAKALSLSLSLFDPTLFVAPIIVAAFCPLLLQQQQAAAAFSQPEGQ